MPFSENLNIEIHQSINDNSPLLAVTDGQVWILPPIGPVMTRDLTLIPSPVAWKSLTESIFPGGSVVFVYRGLNYDTIRDAFLPFAQQVSKAPVVEMSPGARLDHFTQGEFPIFVPAGTPLGRARPVGDWAPINFEIVLVPSLEITPNGPGWARLQDLIAPGATTRRYDPASFFAEVTRSPLLEFAPGHANHPLLDRLTNRTLLEIRDEYDDPYTGTVGVTDGNGANDRLPDAQARGTIVLADSGIGGNPIQDTYIVSILNRVLTLLPSGQEALAQPTRDLTTPSHWSLQSVFMADVEDAANWFASNAQGWPRFTENNRIQYLIDGIATFRTMVDYLRATTDANSFMLLAGWSLDDMFPMIPGDATSTFQALTNAIAQRGVVIRVLLFLNLIPGYFPFAVVGRLNSLPGGERIAFTDGFANATALFPTGSHHQKCLVVKLSSGLTTAFCGGIDIFRDRVDDPDHLSQPGYHDVHAQLDGPVVLELFETLRSRWDTNIAAPAPLPFAPDQVDATGHHFVQLTRTYAPRLNLPFKQPAEDLSTWNTVRRALGRARRFIYLEDQFSAPYAGGVPFDPNRDVTGIVDELMNALARPTLEAFIIVLPNYTAQGQNRYRRQQFIKLIKNAYPNKFFVFYLYRGNRATGPPQVSLTSASDLLWDPSSASLDADQLASLDPSSGGPKHPDEIYVHSKVWIVDDVYAKIGSSNANTRSLTHDSEADLHVIDGGILNGGRRFARNLRIALWGEHLSIPPVLRNARLEDPIAALDYWRHPSANARIREYREDEDVGSIHPDYIWDRYIDPDGRP
jgi:phosphatidylserine/phosphatidylglycerophosphate/cardiolipin synthase-like enzyme